MNGSVGGMVNGCVGGRSDWVDGLVCLLGWRLGGSASIVEGGRSDLHQPCIVHSCSSRPQILQCNGLSMSDFGDQEEALKVADEIIKVNAQEFEHEKDPIVHTSMPLLNRYWYVHSKGLKRTLENKEKKSVDLEADVKKLKDVQDAHIFLEGMGASGSAGSSSVKVENPAYVRVNSVKDALKSKP